MSAIDMVRAVLDGDMEAAAAECNMELDARREELLAQGTDFVINSLSDDLTPDSE